MPAIMCARSRRQAVLDPCIALPIDAHGTIGGLEIGAGRASARSGAACRCILSHGRAVCGAGAPQAAAAVRPRLTTDIGSRIHSHARRIGGTRRRFTLSGVPIKGAMS
jgi:hypothetical protein